MKNFEIFNSLFPKQREATTPINMNEIKRDIEVTIKINGAYLTEFEPVPPFINGECNVDLELTTKEISIVDVKISEIS